MKRLLFLMITMVFVVFCGVKADEYTNLSSGITIDFKFKETVGIGSNVVWSVTVSNAASTTRTCIVQVDVDAMGYNDGSSLGDVAFSIATNTLDANETATVSVTLLASKYTAWLGKTNAFGVSAIVQVSEPEDFWASVTHTIIAFPVSSNILTLVPATLVPVGSVVTAIVSYLNPLPITLHNVTVHFTADKGLSTNNTLVESQQTVGTVGTNQNIFAAIKFIAGQPGISTVWAVILADEFPEGKNDSKEVVVYPRSVLEALVALKPEALEVSPGILTAFVRLPEGYPVSGIISATCDGAAPERMMPNDDGTEMIIKFRRKDIEAALAQTGESLDTSFVVRGVWKDATRTLLFQGTASIKKIVGAKSK